MAACAAIGYGCLVSGLPAKVQAAETNRRWTVALELNGNHIEGMPLEWSSRQVRLLARDGRLWEFAPSAARQFRKSSSTFNGYNVNDMRSQLMRELGHDFQITSTGHYIVGHPKGERDLWGERFEDLYRSFVHYFSVRGFRCREPGFPLVAIVFRNQQEFMRYARSEGGSVSPSILGYYSPTSNRVALYDSQIPGDRRWQQNADTIIHEATHQTAFNTGIHSRFAAQPRWVVEGLGTMFEAPGVWNSRRNRRPKDRLNLGRLAGYRRYAASGKLEGSVPTLVASDRLFRTSPDLAYALAWALTHWLVETQPQKYSAYLRRVAGQPQFDSYTQEERLRDFTETFGNNFRMLEARFFRFMEEI